MRGTTSRKVLMFGLATGPHFFVNLVDSARCVGVVGGEVEHVVAAQRPECERLALNHAGDVCDSTQPRELDLFAPPVQAREGVATDDVRVDEKGCGSPKGGTRTAGNIVAGVKA